MAQAMTGGVCCPWKQGLGSSCRGGGMPRPPGNNARAVKIDAETAGTEKSPLLLTEGGTAQAVTGVEGTRCEFLNRPKR